MFLRVSEIDNFILYSSPTQKMDHLLPIPGLYRPTIDYTLLSERLQPQEYQQAVDYVRRLNSMANQTNSTRRYLIRSIQKETISFLETLPEKDKKGLVATILLENIESITITDLEIKLR